MKNSSADFRGAILSPMEPERSARKIISLSASGVEDEWGKVCCSMNLGGRVSIKAAWWGGGGWDSRVAMGVSMPVSGRVVRVRVRSLSRWVIPGEESWTWAEVEGLLFGCGWGVRRSA